MRLSRGEPPLSLVVSEGNFDQNLCGVWRIRNPSTFRIFSPDELESNKLDAVLRGSGRNFQWDVASRAKGGRVIEILSEHTCQAMLQGYTLTGALMSLLSYVTSSYER